MIALGLLLLSVSYGDICVESAGHAVQPAPGSGSFTSNFGYALAVQGRRIFVGDARSVSCAPAGIGCLYEYEMRGDGTLALVNQMYSAASPPNSYFGSSVCVTEDWLFIGADRPVQGTVGAIEIYENVQGQWLFHSVLYGPPGLQPIYADLFGERVRLSGDQLMVSAPYGDSPIDASVGYIATYDYDGVSWVTGGIVYSPEPQSGSYFGLDFDVEGDFLVVGAPYFDSLVPYSGAAYSFTKSIGGSWAFHDKIEEDAIGQVYFGCQVELNSTCAFISAPITLGGEGAVYSYAVVPPAMQLTSMVLGDDEMGVHMDLGGGLLVTGTPRTAEVVRIYSTEGCELEEIWSVADPTNHGFGLDVAITNDTLVAGSPFFYAQFANHGEVRAFRLGQQALEFRPDPDGAPVEPTLAYSCAATSISTRFTIEDLEGGGGVGLLLSSLGTQSTSVNCLKIGVGPLFSAVPISYGVNQRTLHIDVNVPTFLSGYTVFTQAVLTDRAASCGYGVTNILSFDFL